jgi:hypothetical protein
VTSKQDGANACPSHLIGWRVRSDQSYKAKGTTKLPWHWDEVHQTALVCVKATITKEVVLAYQDYSKVFKINTDASSKHLGAVITQDNRPIVA